MTTSSRCDPPTRKMSNTPAVHAHRHPEIDPSAGRLQLPDRPEPLSHPPRGGAGGALGAGVPRPRPVRGEQEEQRVTAELQEAPVLLGVGHRTGAR